VIVGGAVDGDLVVVVQHDQLAEAEVAGEAARLARHALHQVAVGGDDVGAVVDDAQVVAVVARGEVRLGERHADGGRDALPERPGRRLDARRVVHLGVAGRAAAPLAVAAQVVHRHVVAGEVQQRVLQHRAVAGRLHVAVAVPPVRAAGSWRMAWRKSA
jgi:hypothetical protein